MCTKRFLNKWTNRLRSSCGKLKRCLQHSQLLSLIKGNKNVWKTSIFHDLKMYCSRIEYMTHLFVFNIRSRDSSPLNHLYFPKLSWQLVVHKMPYMCHMYMAYTYMWHIYAAYIYTYIHIPLLFQKMSFYVPHKIDIRKFILSYSWVQSKECRSSTVNRNCQSNENDDWVLLFCRTPAQYHISNLLNLKK